jgi:hypothetical protein
MERREMSSRFPIGVPTSTNAAFFIWPPALDLDNIDGDSFVILS